MKAARVPLGPELGLDLRARAVNENELHAERGEQVQVVGKVEEAAIGNEIAAERDDESLPAERMNIWRYRLEPVDETVLTGESLTPRRLGVFSRAVFAGGFFIFSDRSGIPFGCACYARTDTRKSI